MGVRGHRRKRGRREWIIGAAAALVLLVVGGAGAVYLKLDANISTFDSAGLSKDRPGAGTADADGHRAVNVLLIGSDSRAGSNASLGGRGTSGVIGRSDTTILLHVYPDHRHAVGVSIPRDALVDIPPCLLPDGTWSPDQPSAMFNAAFSMGDTAQGNPACTQNTVEKLTGMRVDHTVVVDFEGFAAMTSAVRGVDVCVPQDVYSADMNPDLTYRGKLLLRRGRHTLSGRQALDYVRMRHGLGDGSDVGRMMRQQAFLSALIAKIKGEGMNPRTLLPLADAATRSLTVDPGLGSAAKLVSFGLSLKRVDLKDIEFITAPWQYAGSRIDLVHPAVDELFADLAANRPLKGLEATGHRAAPHPAASPIVDGSGIAVGVFNGTTTDGLAGEAARRLTASGFTVTGTATARSQDHPTTLVEYGSSDVAQARTLATLFPGSQLVPLPVRGINLVLGQDFANASSGSSAGLPKAVADGARSAATDACARLSYG
ncbi:LCP family protein [Actinacidiphila yeochonensis]|uniref:LCP family protein n=1 Tax=Actinacidiphila yeochonensis TaxID=89050 RepID=UPI000689952E|nr:LCP family protein [Actinacidiphila yeochonensis]